MKQNRLQTLSYINRTMDLIGDIKHTILIEKNNPLSMSVTFWCPPYIRFKGTPDAVFHEDLYGFELFEIHLIRRLEIQKKLLSKIDLGSSIVEMLKKEHSGINSIHLDISPSTWPDNKNGTYYLNGVRMIYVQRDKIL